MTVEGSGEHGSGYMLDTTEFNAVAKGDVAISAYSGWRLFATHVQLDELENTPNEQLRAKLRATFEKIAPERLVTESLVWDVSKWDEAKWPSEDSVFARMLARLEQLDGKKLYPKQHRDILIAETAIKNGLTLVTGDANLRTVTAEFGGRTIEPPRNTGS